MKKLLVVLLILMVTVFSCAENSALAEMLPVGQLPPSETWTENIETVNGPITVDITISLPEITRLPIYEVAYRQFKEEELKKFFPQATINILDTGALVIQGEPGNKIYPIDPDDCAWTDWPENGDYAEAATESKQDVENMLQALWCGIYDGGHTSIWTRGVYTHSRTWRKEKNGELVEPVNEHGYYNFHLERAIDGITVFDQLFFQRDDQRNSGPHTESMTLCYYDENNFDVQLSGFEIVRTMAEDVPILPFDTIKETLRTLISTGHLREIYRMELCYLPMWSDTRDSIITVPAWVVYGEYHETAKAPSYEDTDSYYLRVLGGFPLVLPAQMGQVIDYADANPNRWLASTYLTEW